MPDRSGRVASGPRKQDSPLNRQVRSALEIRLAELGWTRRRLATEAGLKEQYVSAIMRGCYSPGLSMVERLFLATGATPWLEYAEASITTEDC